MVLNIAIWATILFFAFSRFANLGYGDLKDWDECLYAWRAKLVVLRGDWLDQSTLSWEGFYSAAFPPLQVWITAILFKIFGFTEVAARIWSALTGAGSVVMLFLLGRRMGRNRWTGLFAAVLMGSIWYYTIYSRRSQFDVPYTFWIIVSLYGYIGYLDHIRIAGKRELEVERRAWFWLVFAGVALGLGLMTKIALALMAPIFMGVLSMYSWVRGRHSFKQVFFEQLVVNGVALLLIAPWHIAMTLSPKGDEFWGWYIGKHLLGRADHAFDAHAGPWYYYIGTLWINLSAPLLALTVIATPAAVVWIIRSFWKKDPEDIDEIWSTAEEDRDRPLRNRDLRYLLPLVWFGFQFLLFSSSATKREPYTIPMYPPIVLLCALYLGERLRDRRRMLLLAATFGLMVGFLILSRMRTFGDSVEAMMLNLENIDMFPDVLQTLAILFVSSLAGALVLWLFVARYWPKQFRTFALLTILSMVMVLSWRENRRVFEPEKGADVYGWKNIRKYINNMDEYDTLVIGGIYLHPAALYYLNGLNLPIEQRQKANWLLDKRFIGLDAYDHDKVAQLKPEQKVRVIIMKTHTESRWTEEQRRELLDRCKMLSEGIDMAIYDLVR